MCRVNTVNTVNTVMDIPMVYYKRTTVHNLTGQWLLVDNPYRQWIQGYFQQRVRDVPVVIVANEENGNRTMLLCTMDTNDKIRGETTRGERIEIIWCRENIAEETLARYI